MPSITLTDPTTLTTVASGLIATNNANLRALLNSGLDGVNLKGAPALATGEFPVWNGTVFVRSSTLPPTGLGVMAGIIEMFGGAAAPTGYVLCDGASYLRTGGTYDALFAAISTNFGAVDGTHFNVPDLRGRVPVGFAVSGGHTDVATLGNNDGVATANRRPKHRHTPHTHNLTVDAGAGAVSVLQPPSARTAASSSALIASADGGSGNANDSLDAPAYVVINYIIKL